MRILAIGDFHGKFPKKLKKKLNRENFDILISPGDFCGSEKMERLFWKYIYGTEFTLEDILGKKKFKELEKNSFWEGKKILEKLKTFKKEIFVVSGNWDPCNLSDIGFKKEKELFSKDYMETIKKLGINLLDFRKNKKMNIVGFPRSTYPGIINKKTIRRIRENYANPEEKIKKIKEDNKKYFKLFKKLIDKESIFISHNCPYKTKLDKIKKGEKKGEHYGSFLVKKIVNEISPLLVICGHMHENQGKQKIGRTWIVNTGSAREGKAALIDIDENRTIKNIRLIR